MDQSPSVPSGALERVVGIELADAGTRITALAETRKGSRSATRRSAAPPAPDEAVEHVEGLVQQLAVDMVTPPPALGIAVSGRVNANRGIVHFLRYATGWEDFPLASRLRRLRDIPIHIDSATNAAALAEAMLGAGVGHRHILYVLLAQSVSAGYVFNGHILHGAHGAEGVLAHMRVRDDGPRCSCGAIGHVEPLASAQAIVRNMIGRASGSDESAAAMLRASGGRAEAMSVAQVARLAAEGEPAAAAVIASALDALAPALTNAIALLDPDIVIIGGPLAHAGAAFFDQLTAAVGERCRPFMPPPPIVAGTLEPRAVLLGARLLPTSAVTGATVYGGP